MLTNTRRLHAKADQQGKKKRRKEKKMSIHEKSLKNQKYGTASGIDFKLAFFWGIFLVKNVYQSYGGVSEWLKEHAWKACVR